MKKKKSEALGEERLGWKNRPSKRRMGSLKDEWVVKRRMGNRIARLIDDDEVAIKY